MGTLNPAQVLDVDGGSAWLHQPATVQWPGGGETGDYTNLRLGEAYGGGGEVAQLRTGDTGGWGHMTFYGTRFTHVWDFTHGGGSGDVNVLSIFGSLSPSLIFSDYTNYASPAQSYLSQSGGTFQMASWSATPTILNLFSGVNSPQTLILNGSNGVTNAANDYLWLTRQVNAGLTPAAGLGVGINFQLENTASTLESAAAIRTVLTQPGTTNSAALTFSTEKTGTLSEVVRIDPSGNVGINTTAPCSNSYAPSNCKLSVKGAIQATEVVVNTGWSDYVFGG